MRVSSTKYVCDICNREIEYNAINKRLGLLIREDGLVLREASTGNICETCKSLLQGTFGSFVEIVRDESMRVELEMGALP